MDERAYSRDEYDRPSKVHLVAGDDEDDKRNDSEGEEMTCPQFKRRGLVWAILSGAFQALQVIILSEVSSAMNPLQTTFLRSIFLLAFVFLLSWEEGRNYDCQDMVLYIAYGILDLLGISGLLFATEFLPISDVSAISYNQSIPSTILACILLGEAFDVFDALLAIFNAIGLVLVCETSMSTHVTSGQGPPIFGICLAFFALFCLISLKLIARKLSYRGRQDPSLLSLIVGLTGIMLSSAYLTITDSWDMPNTKKDVWLTVSLGIVAICHFYSFSKALQTENIIFIATALTLPIPATFVYDVIVKGIPFSVLTIVGVGLTLGSTLLLYLKAVLKSADREL